MLMGDGGKIIQSVLELQEYAKLSQIPEVALERVV